MGYAIKQSQTAQALVFLMVDSSDHISPKTGLTVAVTLSKNGAAFAAPSGAVSEIGNGWYKVAGHSGDSNTLGPLVLHATATGADPTDDTFIVVAFDPQDAAALGLSRLDAAITSRSSHTAAQAGAEAANAILATPSQKIKTDASNRVEASSVQGSVTGSVASVSGNVGGNLLGNVTGSVGSLGAQAKADVRLEAATALGNAGVTSEQVAKLDNLDEPVSQVALDVWGADLADPVLPSSAAGNLLRNADAPISGVASEVWSADERSLTDKEDFSLTASQRVKLDAAQPDYAPAKAGDAMALTPSERTSVAAAVWAATTRTLSSFGTLIADVWAYGVRTLSDKTGFSLTGAERTAIANEVEAQIIDDTDSEKVLQAITDKIAAANPSLSGLTLSAIASAVWGAATRTLTAFGYTVNTNANATELAVATAIAALNNLSAAQVRTEADAALAAYDAPTHAEMVARTLPSASYALDSTAQSIVNLLTPEMANVDALVTKLNTMLELGGSAYRFTVAALANVPQGEGGGFTDEDRDSLTAVRGKVESLGSARVIVQSPISPDGLKIKLVRGDDYSATEGRALDFSFVNILDLTGATVRLSISKGQSHLTLEGTLLSSLGDAQRVRFEMTAAQTGSLELGTYKGDVEAELSNGHRLTLRYVEVEVGLDYTR